jgi:hypothetical protein
MEAIFAEEKEQHGFLQCGKSYVAGPEFVPFLTNFRNSS